LVVPHTKVVDWQSNEEIKRLMRRDIKRELARRKGFTLFRRDELAMRIVDLVERRSGQ
jgi:hypothetical protein